MPDRYSAHDLIVQDEEIFFENLVVRDRDRHEVLQGKIFRRQRIHVNSERGAVLMQEKRLTFPGSSALTVLDARTMKADGTTTHATGESLRVQRVTAHGRAWTTVSFEDVRLGVGDELEVVTEQSANGVYTAREHMVRGEYPIVHKVVRITTDPGIAPKIDTYNGFPEPEIDPVGMTSSRRWTFDMLDPLPSDPLALVKNCVPFFTMRYGPPHGLSMADFDERYPRDVLTGRKNMHAFTRYVNAVRNRYALHDLLGPAREIVRFLRDSMIMVPDTSLVQDVPMGEYFVRRTISREKLFIMYRSMLRILEAPLFICEARSRYEGRFAKESDTENSTTHEFIAFTEEGEQDLHFIYPNTLHERFLVDELPVELSGGTVEVLPYKDSGINASPFSLELPNTTGTRNYKQERIMVELDPDGSISGTTLRGSLGGQLPLALEADTVNDGQETRARRIHAWIQRHFALNASRDLHLEKIDSVVPRVWKYDSAGSRDLPDKVLRNDSGLFLFVPEAFVGWKPFIDDRSALSECPSLLPFTYHLRSDLIVHASDPIRTSELDQTSLDVYNHLGQFTASMEQPDPTTLVFHYDLSFFNDLIDRSVEPFVEQLQNAIDQRLKTPIAFGL